LPAPPPGIRHEVEPPPVHGVDTEASAANLVATLTEALRSTRDSGPHREMASRAKTLADLLRNAPKYDGTTDLLLWKKRIMEYLRRR
jgi:hypothetical protein